MALKDVPGHSISENQQFRDSLPTVPKSLLGSAPQGPLVPAPPHHQLRVAEHVSLFLVEGHRLPLPAVTSSCSSQFWVNFPNLRDTHMLSGWSRL